MKYIHWDIFFTGGICTWFIEMRFTTGYNVMHRWFSLPCFGKTLQKFYLRYFSRFNLVDKKLQTFYLRYFSRFNLVDKFLILSIDLQINITERSIHIARQKSVKFSTVRRPSWLSSICHLLNIASLNPLSTYQTLFYGSLSCFKF